MNIIGPTLHAAAASAIDRIKAEHRVLDRVLGAMQALVTHYRGPDAPVDYELLESMLRYVEDVPDKLHHPKEDRVLFPAIALHAGDGEALVRELQRDHARGGRMLAEMRRALRILREGGPNALNQLATATDEFTEFYLHHMRKEEEQLLPLAVEILSQEDWQRVDQAFSGNANALAAGDPGHEYRRLYRLISERTPSPLNSIFGSDDS